MQCLKFGELLTENKNNQKSLDLIFKDTKSQLNKFYNNDAEQQIALEKLRKLTIELQTKSLRHRTKASCKYFTI